MSEHGVWAAVGPSCGCSSPIPHVHEGGEGVGRVVGPGMTVTRVTRMAVVGAANAWKKIKEIIICS